MEKVECPYCEEYVNIDPMSQEHYEDICVYECLNCSKNFEVYAEPSIHYSSVGRKAECLNGGEHKWIEANRFPKIFGKVDCKCTDCSETKTVSEEIAKKEGIING